MYTVIVDSSADMDSTFKIEYPTEIIPFHLFLGEEEYLDDENFDVAQFVDDFSTSDLFPTSQSPSSDKIFQIIEKASDEVFIVSISSKLSTLYSNILEAVEKYHKHYPGTKKIHVFDSKTASVGETAIVEKIHTLKRLAYGFDEIVRHTQDFIDNLRTYFVLESLDNLMKNGRISKWQGIIAGALGILPIMGANSDGEIYPIEKVMSLNKTYEKLIEMVSSEMNEYRKRAIYISHVGNFRRANEIILTISENVSRIDKTYNFVAGGLSSLYAYAGGIIIAV